MFASTNNGLNRNTIASILSGVLFALGWWLVIDATRQYSAQTDFNKVYLLIGVVSTFALILANSVSNSKVQGEGSDDSCSGQCGARFVLFVSFILAFGALIASAWLLFGSYILHKKSNLYPGLAIFGQNLAIFISTFILKFGRRENVVY